MKCHTHTKITQATHTSGLQIKLCKLTVEKIVLKKNTIPDIEFLIHSTGQININFLFFCNFLNITFGFFLSLWQL